MSWTQILHTCPCCGRPLPLIDRVTEVLEREPNAPLGKVLQQVRSDDISMVATMVRMVQLRQRRARVGAIPKRDSLSQTSSSPRRVISAVRVIASGGD